MALIDMDDDERRPKFPSQPQPAAPQSPSSPSLPGPELYNPPTDLNARTHTNVPQPAAGTNTAEFDNRYGYNDNQARNLGYTDAASLNRANAGTLLNDLAKKYNVTVNQGDVESLLNRSQYGQFGGNLNLAAQDFEGQYRNRSDPRERDSSGRLAGSSVEPAGQFTDPLASRVEGYANDRFNRLNSPPAGSGQALLEQALKDISGQFRSGGYTPAELENFQTQAIDPLERLRTQRKQQVAHELSRRGIAFNPAAPEGIAKSMMDDVDRQFDAMRSQQQTQLGSQAANETRGRMLQALELLSGLAQTEEGRLDKAFGYTQVPLQLADRAFNQASQVYGMSNPMNLFGPASQLANIGMSQQGGSQQALANLAWLLLNSGQAL